jgi:hypothetical protein
MNERIKELMLEAGIYECDDFEPHPTFKKFAQLIVRECADFVSETATIETLLGDRLKEHFGVE